MDPDYMYQHPPLDCKGKEIRLLHVEPRIRGKPISCQLKTVVLDDATRYAALSYTWGDDPHVNMPRILLNGKVFQVRKNLYNFLARMADENIQHVRLLTSERRLRVDSIGRPRTQEKATLEYIPRVVNGWKLWQTF